MADLFKLTGPPRITLDDTSVIDLPLPAIDNFMQASGANETAYKSTNIGQNKMAGYRKLRPDFRFQLCGITTTFAETLAATLAQGEFSFTPRTKATADPADALEVSYRVRVSGAVPISARVHNQNLELVDYAIELESIETSIVSRQGILIVTIESENAGGSEGAQGEIFKDKSIALVTPEGKTSTLIEYLYIPIRADFNPYDGRYYSMLANGQFHSCAGDGNDDQTHFVFVGTVKDMLVIKDGPNKGDVYILENFSAGDDRLYRWPTRDDAPVMVHLNAGSITDMEAVAITHNSDENLIAVGCSKANASIRHHDMEVVGAGSIFNTTTQSPCTGITYIHKKLVYFVHGAGRLRITSAQSDSAYTDHSFFTAQGPIYYDRITGRIYMDEDSMFYVTAAFGASQLFNNHPPVESTVGFYQYRSIAVHR